MTALACHIRPAVPADLERLRSIYNDAVLHTTASYDYEPRTAEAQATWFATKQAAGYPVLVADAAGQGLHLMAGAIDAANRGGIEMHRRLGFESAGVMKEAGYKFDRWLDLAFMTRRLDRLEFRPAPG